LKNIIYGFKALNIIIKMYEVCGLFNGLFNGLCNAALWTTGLLTTQLIIYRNFKKYDPPSYINAGSFQMFVTMWAGYNILNETDSYAIDNSMFGYYMYDTIIILFDPSGIQTFYLMHHTLAIVMIYLNNTYQFSPFVYRNLLYFLMESSSGMLNWMRLVDLYKTRISKYKFKVLTYSVFGITRCVIYPFCVIHYLYNTYQHNWFHSLHLLSLITIYIMSFYCLTKWVYEFNKLKN